MLSPGPTSNSSYVRQRNLASHTHLSAPKWLFILAVTTALAITGCQKTRTLPAAPKPQSAISVSVQSDGISVDTPTARFRILPSGYLRSYLKLNGRELTMDDPQGKGSNDPDYVVVDGKEIRDFEMDLAHAQIADATHRLGQLGKRIDMKGVSKSRSGIEKTVSVEVYDNFPSLALVTAAYKNAGASPATLEIVTTQRHELNASLINATVRPFAMWSFHGSSEKWGKDNVLLIPKDFSRANPMEQVMKGDPGTGGGVPIVAFWTAEMGEAIGHLETLPLTLNIPVHLDADQRVEASIELSPEQTLQPGDVY